MYLDFRSAFRVTRAALVFLLLGWLPSLPATADSCIRTAPPAQEGPSPAPGPFDDVILDLRPVGESLTVTIDWASVGAPGATLVLSTPDGVDLAAQSVARAPGTQSEHLFPSALVHVATPPVGFQLRLRLEDGSGIRAEVRFRALAHCPEGDPCTFRLIPGLEGGPVFVSQALRKALDEAAGDGSTDLLATVRNDHPELVAEVDGLVWQLQLDTRPVGICSCRWLDVLDHDPATGTTVGADGGNPPRHRFVHNAAGASFNAGIQGIDGKVKIKPPATEGRTTFGIVLFCTRQTGDRDLDLATEWPSRPILELDEPVLETCPAPCTPTIEHSAEVLGCVQATAAGRAELPAEVKAETDAALTLGGRSLIAAAAGVDIDVAGGETVRDLDRFSQSSSASLVATLALVEIEGGAKLELEAEEGSSDHSYAFAAAALDYFLRFEVATTCAPEIPTHEVDLDSRSDFGLSDVDGGVAMETWEDP